MLEEEVKTSSATTVSGETGEKPPAVTNNESGESLIMVETFNGFLEFAQ